MHVASPLLCFHFGPRLDREPPLCKLCINCDSDCSLTAQLLARFFINTRSLPLFKIKNIKFWKIKKVWSYAGRYFTCLFIHRHSAPVTPHATMPAMLLIDVPHHAHQKNDEIYQFLFPKMPTILSLKSPPRACFHSRNISRESLQYCSKKMIRWEIEISPKINKRGVPAVAADHVPWTCWFLA